MTSSVEVQREEHVGIVQLTAPQPNYVDPVLLEQLVAAMKSLSADDGCRAVVLCSTGRHFCAGANFNAGGIGDDRAAAARRLYAAAAQLFDPDTVAVPIVAAVQGAAVGAGLGLACAADFRVAARSARFHANFTKLGFHPGFGLSVTLPRLLGDQRAQELLYGGDRIDAARAEAIGLADRVVPDGEERAAAVAWARDLAAVAPLALRSVRRTLRGGLAAGVRSGLDHELSEQTWLWETADCREGIAATAERRDPVFEGR